jgi:integrase
MSVFKRGGVYWYEFRFMGQRVRESAHTRNKELALSIERKRHTKMEESAGNVKRPKPLLFRKAAKSWLAGNAHWSDSYREINTLKLSHLMPMFGKLLLSEITNSKISKFQNKRKEDGAAGREINMETGVLRMILRKHRLWHLLEPDFHPLQEREDVGQALTWTQTNRLLTAAINSRSRSLFPALMTYFLTGVRVAELRRARWSQVDFERRIFTVGKSKTRGGEGRPIPLNDEAFEILVEWHSRFENPQPEDFIFPSERYGFDGHNSHLTGKVKAYEIDPSKPMGSWKSAWTTCRKAAGVWCRLYDARHTFISALGEAGVPESTIKAIAGWMSAKMLERYSHTRNEAKRMAVKRLPRLMPARVPPKSPTV